MMELLHWALQERDQALESVTKTTCEQWRSEAMALVRREIKDGEIFTAEDVRILCESHALVPHHRNAWGAFIKFILRRGYMEETGKWVPMVSKRSKGRRTPQYRRTT